MDQATTTPIASAPVIPTPEASAPAPAPAAPAPTMQNGGALGENKWNWTEIGFCMLGATAIIFLIWSTRVKAVKESKAVAQIKSEWDDMKTYIESKVNQKTANKGLTF